MPSPVNGLSDRDPYLWLEEVEGADALAWVRERNRATHAALAGGGQLDGIRPAELGFAGVWCI